MSHAPHWLPIAILAGFLALIILLAVIAALMLAGLEWMAEKAREITGEDDGVSPFPVEKPREFAIMADVAETAIPTTPFVQIRLLESPQ